MGKRRRIIEGSSAVALSTSYSNVITFTGIPDECWLDHLQGVVDTIASSAANITWKITEDAGGDYPFAGEVTETIVTGETTATDGGITTLLRREYRVSSSGTSGSLTVWAKTDTGTCNLNAYLRIMDGD